MANHAAADFTKLFKGPIEVSEVVEQKTAANETNNFNSESISTELSQEKQVVKRGRPKSSNKKKSFTMSFTEETRAKLATISMQRGMNSSSFLSSIIEQLYEEHIANGGRAYDEGVDLPSVSFKK